MTTTEDILALAANAAPTRQAAEDLASFAAAAARGMNTNVVQALRGLRPASGAPALPDSPAWRAWLSATAAIAAQAPADRTVRHVVCAAATAVGGAQAAVPGGAQSAVPSGGGQGAVSGGGGQAAVPGGGQAPPLHDDRSAAVAAGVAAADLIESRLAGLADPGGWSLPVVSAAIGAGLAAGLMLRLTPSQLRYALGICATQAAGLHAADGTGAGPVQAGKAAFNAVEAAHLARLGFTSSAEPLDGRRALFALFSV